MKLYTSLNGLVQVQVTSADIPSLLRALDGLELLGCTAVGDLSVELTLRRSALTALQAICRRRGDQVMLCRRLGLYWTLKGLFSRPVLVAGGLIFLLMAAYLPSRIFFVEVEGNLQVPTALILEAAEGCGIGFGANRREVRSEKMKNALLEAVPQLQWAGVNTYGCVARISVRERAVEEKQPEQSPFGHIVSVRDGFITSCTATRGSLLCAPGQAVAAGDILISGYSDLGLTIRAEQAEGEVYARTRREVAALSPLFGERKGDTVAESKKISLLIGKKRIFFGKDSGIWDTTCDRMYEEYYITLPGGFRLPVAIVLERFRFREMAQGNVEDAQMTLSHFGERYLKTQMLAGTIEASQLSYEEWAGWLKLAGEYDCIEMIGKMQRQQMGDTNE